MTGSPRSLHSLAMTNLYAVHTQSLSLQGRGTRHLLLSLRAKQSSKKAQELFTYHILSFIIHVPQSLSLRATLVAWQSIVKNRLYIRQGVKLPSDTESREPVIFVYDWRDGDRCFITQIDGWPENKNAPQYASVLLCQILFSPPPQQRGGASLAAATVPIITSSYLRIKNIVHISNKICECGYFLL